MYSEKGAKHGHVEKEGRKGMQTRGAFLPSWLPEDILQTAWTLEADPGVDPDRADRRAPVRLDDTPPHSVRVCTRHCSIMSMTRRMCHVLLALAGKQGV